METCARLTRQSAPDAADRSKRMPLKGLRSGGALATECFRQEINQDIRRKQRCANLWALKIAAGTVRGAPSVPPDYGTRFCDRRRSEPCARGYVSNGRPPLNLFPSGRDQSSRPGED